MGTNLIELKGQTGFCIYDIQMLSDAARWPSTCGVHRNALIGHKAKPRLAQIAPFSMLLGFATTLFHYPVPHCSVER